MEIKNFTVKESILLGRKEVSFDVIFTGTATPKKAELREVLAKKYETTAELVSVNKCITSFGKNIAKCTAHIYKDEKVLKELEIPKGKKEKKLKKKRKKK